MIQRNRVCACSHSLSWQARSTLCKQRKYPASFSSPSAEIDSHCLSNVCSVLDKQQMSTSAENKTKRFKHQKSDERPLPKQKLWWCKRFRGSFPNDIMWTQSRGIRSWFGPCVNSEVVRRSRDSVKKAHRFLLWTGFRGVAFHVTFSDLDFSQLVCFSGRVGANCGANRLWWTRESSTGDQRPRSGFSLNNTWNFSSFFTKPSVLNLLDGYFV